MRKRFAVLATALTVMLTCGGAALAITNGQPDRNNHPYVGLINAQVSSRGCGFTGAVLALPRRRRERNAGIGDRLHVPESESVHTGPARFPCLDRRRGQVLRSRRGPRISAVDVRDIAAAAAASFHPALIPREHSRLHPRPTPASAKNPAGRTPGRTGRRSQANAVNPIQATRASTTRRHASEERTLAQAS